MKKYKIEVSEQTTERNTYKEEDELVYWTIYTQEVDEIELNAVIKAVNKF